jgi:DNA-binding beta-propeller fold protein YncE
MLAKCVKFHSIVTLNNKLLYATDQTELKESPVSNKISVIDIPKDMAKVISAIKVRNKLHDVVASKDGKTVFTNTSDNTITIIDEATQKNTGYSWKRSK